MIGAGDNRLPALAKEVAGLHREIGQHATAMAEKALEAGAALSEAKALCKHGTWANWLKNTGIPERSAQRYMKLHRAGLKSATVADLGGIAEAEKFLSKTRFTSEADMDRAARAWLQIWAAESETLDGWLAYGAALNEAKELLKDDDAWKAWLEESFPETGMRVVTYEERDAAMWAAANPEQFEIARAAVERAT